jgi:hypothetical protein
MPYLVSAAPDITEGLPAQIAARAVADRFSRTTVLPDMTIAGMPFRVAPVSTSDGLVPYSRSTPEWKHSQIDMSTSPGEQTLSSWWTRVQDSWHRGAGITFYEPGSVKETEYRYRLSAGLDVWTQGRLRLLKKMEATLAGSGGATAGCAAAVVGGVNTVFGMVDGVLHRWTDDTDVSYTSSYLFGNPVVAGSTVLSAYTTGMVAGSTAGSTLAQLWYSTAGPLTPYWIKSRIIAFQANRVYELTLDGGNLSAVDPLWTHPDPAWQWTGAAEAPGAIILCGKSNGVGEVYAAVLEDQGSGLSPILGTPSSVCTLPLGEECTALLSYLGGYVALGTSRGLRVGVMDATGKVQYGPLLFEAADGVSCLAARGTHVYAGVTRAIDGLSGLARVDLSEEITDLRYPWAWDVTLDDVSAPVGVCPVGNTDRMAVAAVGSGVWVQSATVYVPAGYLYTGTIRYATNELKAFLRARIRADISGTESISLSTVDEPGTEQLVTALTGASNTGADIDLQAALPLPMASTEFLLRVAPSTGGLSTPTLRGLSIKALPVPYVLPEVVYPLSCYDRETDRRGVPYGFEGSAWARIGALEALLATAPIVDVVDTASGETYTARLETVNFRRVTPSEGGHENWGGMLLVKVTKL